MGENGDLSGFGYLSSVVEVDLVAVVVFGVMGGGDHDAGAAFKFQDREWLFG